MVFWAQSAATYHIRAVTEKRFLIIIMITNNINNDDNHHIHHQYLKKLNSYFLLFTAVLSQCDFSHWKFGLLSTGKTSFDRVVLPNLLCTLGVKTQLMSHNPPNIFNVRTDVNACNCTRGCTGTRKRVCTESWLWEKNPLPHRGIEPSSAAWTIWLNCRGPNKGRTRKPTKFKNHWSHYGSKLLLNIRLMSSFFLMYSYLRLYLFIYSFLLL